MLTLINPFGGMGQAKAKWVIAKELLDLCHLEIDLKETERVGHVYDILKNEVQLG